MREETQQALDNILDTMTGADGGIRFALFKFSIEDLDEQAENGNESAQKIIDLMKRFSKLIDLTTERK